MKAYDRDTWSSMMCLSLYFSHCFPNCEALAWGKKKEDKEN